MSVCVCVCVSQNSATNTHSPRFMLLMCFYYSLSVILEPANWACSASICSTWQRPHGAPPCSGICGSDERHSWFQNVLICPGEPSFSKFGQGKGCYWVTIEDPFPFSSSIRNLNSGLIGSKRCFTETTVHFIFSNLCWIFRYVTSSLNIRRQSGTGSRYIFWTLV